MKSLLLVFAFFPICSFVYSQSYFRIVDKETREPLKDYGLELISDKYEGFATLVGTIDPEIYTYQTWGGYSSDNYSGNLYLSANKATHMPSWIPIDISSTDTLLVELVKDPNYVENDSELSYALCGERVYQSYSPRPLRRWSDLPLKASEAVKEKLVWMIGESNFRRLYISSIFEHKGDAKVGLANEDYFKTEEKKYDICLSLSDPSAGLGMYSTNLFVTESGVILSHPKLPFDFGFSGEKRNWEFLSKIELEKAVRKCDRKLLELKPEFRFLDAANVFVWEYKEVVGSDDRGLTKFKYTSFDAITGELVGVIFIENIVLH